MVGVSDHFDIGGELNKKRFVVMERCGHMPLKSDFLCDFRTVLARERHGLVIQRDNTRGRH